MFKDENKFCVGDKAKGFKFDSDTDGVNYVYDMDDYVGVIGEVVESLVDSFVILFPDQWAWRYPASLSHLAKVEEEVIPSFKVGDRVKFKKSSLTTGMIDATEDDVFEVGMTIGTGPHHVRLVNFESNWSVNHFEHVKEEIMEEQKIENQTIAWEVGQEVFCLLRGKGVIAYTSHGGNYPIEVEFEKDFEYYTQDGKLFDYHKNRSLFFSEPVVTAELFPPKKPFVPTLKRGDRVHIYTKGGLFPEGVVREVFSEVDDRIYISEDGHYFMKHDIESVRILGEEIKFS